MHPGDKPGHSSPAHFQYKVPTRILKPSPLLLPSFYPHSCPSLGTTKKEQRCPGAPMPNRCLFCACQMQQLGCCCFPSRLWQDPFSTRQRECSAPAMGVAGMLSFVRRFPPRGRAAAVLLPPLGRGNPAVRLAHSCCSFPNADRLLGLAASWEHPGYQLYWAG